MNRAAARIAALVAAVALIVAALVVRSHRDATARRGPYRLTCASEFTDVCQPLSSANITVTIEPAGVTADRLVSLPDGGESGFDGWLAAGPWARMVSDARQAAAAAPITRSPTTVGGGRVAVAVWRDRLDVLRKSCGGALNWRCLSDAAARSTWTANGGSSLWGLVKIALPSPVTESDGLAGLAAATSGFTNSTAFVAADLAQSDDYQHRLTSLARAIPRPSPSLATILTQGPATADVYIGLDAEINPVVKTAAKQSQVEVVYRSPVLDVDVLLAGAAQHPRAVPNELKNALAAWPKRHTDPNPSSGAMAGLRALWKETIK